MGKKKTTTTNQVAFAAPPETADTSALRNAAQTNVDFSTPIRNAYARAKQQNDATYANPLGAYTTADVRDKSLRTQNANFNQSMGLDLSNAAQQNAQGQFGRLATVAGMTRPQMYNSGGTQTVSDPMGTIGQIGSKASGAAMMAM